MYKTVCWPIDKAAVSQAPEFWRCQYGVRIGKMEVVGLQLKYLVIARTGSELLYSSYPLARNPRISNLTSIGYNRPELWPKNHLHKLCKWGLLSLRVGLVLTLHLKGNSGCKAKTYTTRSTCIRLSAGQLTRQPFHRHLSSDVVNMVSQNQQNGGHSFLQNWLEKSYKCQVCIDREPLPCSLCCASFRPGYGLWNGKPPPPKTRWLTGEVPLWRSNVCSAGKSALLIIELWW